MVHCTIYVEGLPEGRICQNVFIVEQGMNRTDENIDPFKVDPPG